MSLLRRTVEADMLLSVAPRLVACGIPRRRLRDVLVEINLLDVQLHIIQQAAGPHRLKGVGQRIAALHRRLDALEHQLRLRALQVEENPSGLTSFELRRRLGNMVDRRRWARAPRCRVLERRRAGRRASETPSPESEPNLYGIAGPGEMEE